MMAPWQIIDGAFVVAEMFEGRSRSGERFLRLGLLRGTETICAYAFADSCRGYRTPRAGEALRLKGRLRQRHGKPEIRCLCLAPQAPDAAQRQARIYARAMLSWIGDNPLGTLLRDVFRDPTVGPAFSRCPASIAHHHAYPGGLLVHSVEVAWRLFREPVATGDKPLLLAAALLHDVGKVRCYTPDGRRTRLGMEVHHDALTLEILAPYLGGLDRQWPAGAARLRRLLTWHPTRTQPTPPDRLTALLREADRLSAGFELASDQPCVEPFRPLAVTSHLPRPSADTP
jgi:3'-5' exoribonuclease